MDATAINNSQYALQLALQTLKERCAQLQKRINILEEENLGLKLKGSKEIEHCSSTITTTSSLETQVCKLAEEKKQLKNTIAMVANENKQLWSNLSRLTNENKNLGSQISKISDTLHKTPLIRSRTFTQDAPHTKHLQKVLSENDKMSLELEDISLKLQNSFSKEKCELEMQVAEMANLKEFLSFNYLHHDLDVDNSIIEGVELHLADLKSTKSIVEKQNLQLQAIMENLNQYKGTLELQQIENDRKSAPEEAEDISKAEQDWGTPDSSLQMDQDHQRICPMCSQKFQADMDFDEFTRHVEKHFMESDVLRL